ncbi:MAG: T9SS type A sorting domain-containing protein [Candidatus Kapabacteria bacterium]|nr:T9SS type A sorting domain-containing protein [Candidatus Kapabacteria bacterium]
MFTSTTLSRLLMTIAVFAFGFIGMTAQLRPVPTDFGAKVITEPNAAPYVLLSWIGIKGDNLPTAYFVYRATGQTEDEAKFDKIGGVEVNPTTPPRENLYTFIVKDLKPGVYTFFVRAVWGKDEVGPRTPIKVVVLQNGVEAKVWFVTEPVKKGTEGKPYEYKARAEKSVDGILRYSLVSGPDGMTINAETGVLSWANPKAGRYEITIKAAVEANGVVTFANQSFVLEIIKGDTPKFCAAIYGEVKFENPILSSVAQGVVVAWRLDKIKKDGGVTEAYVPVYKAEIKQGSYVLEVPEGTYKLRIEGANFLAEWFENSGELADAKSITIACNSREKVNFTVAARPEPTLIVVKGRVLDALTEGGLKGLVVFEARAKEGSEVDARYRRVVAETNADGMYEIRLQAGVGYIASAKVLGRDNKESEYLNEFWNNTNDGSQATIIKLIANEDGVNFPMDKRPVFNNGFGGMMKNHYTNAGVPGKVIAYQLTQKVKDGGDTIIDKRNVQTVETDANFGYRFSNLQPGKYIVFGVPSARPYIPGWMVLSNKAATEWRNATRVDVGDAVLEMQYDIRLDTAKGERGKGRVRGFVFDKRGGVMNNGKGDDQVQNSSAIMGSLVTARDEAGDIIDFALTENEGAFDLTELSIGAVTLTADRLDFEPATQVVNVDAVNADQQVSIGLVQSVTSVDVPVNEVGGSVNLWPNPTTGSASIRFVSTTGTADIRILSMTGVVLATQNVTVNGGETTVTLSTGTLPSGMVMVQVTNGASTFALPLQIVR